jgi:hypothetical protein
MLVSWSLCIVRVTKKYTQYFAKCTDFIVKVGCTIIYVMKLFLRIRNNKLKPTLIFIEFTYYIPITYHFSVVRNSIYILQIRGL